MKWSLSEIKKHATPVPNGNPLVIRLLKDLAEEQKVKLQQWVPFEDVINLENELQEMLNQHEQEDKSILQTLSPTACFARGYSRGSSTQIKRILGVVKS